MLNDEAIFSVQASTLSSSRTFTQNCGSISIWGVGVVICRGLQPLRITGNSKRITALPFEIRKCRPAETFRETLQICTLAPVGGGLLLTGVLMGFAVN
jgi:hypothetical protein